MKDETFNEYYKSTDHFRIVNPNPAWESKRGFVWDRPDCVIRALANTTGWEWVKSYDYLSTKARRDYTIPNDGARLRVWVAEDGATWTPCKAEKGKKRTTALQFAKDHPTGRFVLSLANHVCACVDGVILDAWNCGEKVVYGFNDMESFNAE